VNREPTAVSPNKKAFEEAVAAVPSCALTEEGVQAQRARMQRLGPSVARFQRGEDRVTIGFQAGFDQQLLDETLAVERECCPFFRFDFDQGTRQLTVSVEDAEHRAGLDALAHALGVGQSVEWRCRGPCLPLRPRRKSGGAFLIWRAVREGAGPTAALLGALALTGYGFLASLQTDPHFGRVLAAYGGVFVSGSLVWGLLVDGFRPDRFDLTGAMLCLAGAAVIIWAPR
jgi:small multidrug resistance family-3 protein